MATRPSAGASSEPSLLGIGNRAVAEALEERREHAPEIVHDILRSVGEPLPDESRATMEAAFATSFGDVRIHTDPGAEASAEAVNARAYTVGRHIVFGPATFAPDTPAGERLLAHELAHVVQQRGLAPGPSLRIAHDAGAERSATTAASRVTSAEAMGAVGTIAAPAVQREEKKGWFASAAESVSVAQETVTIKGIGLAVGAISAPAGRLVEAMLWGMLEELKTQEAARAAQAWARVTEAISSPTVFLPHYAWGLVKGIFSPITGLFDMGKLALKLQYMQAQLMASAWKNRGVIAGEAGELAGNLDSLAAKGRTALSDLKKHPVASVQALNAWLDALGKEAEAKAKGAGKELARSLASTLDKPLPELAEIAGEIVGTVLINIVLLVFTAGIGDAIAQVATKLGELGSYLGKFGEAAAMLGKFVGQIGELLATIGGWITKAEGLIAKGTEAVLKPFKPLLDELGRLMGGLRKFLRNVLGVADEAATAGAERVAGAGAETLESKLPTAPAAPTPPPKPATAPTTAAPKPAAPPPAATAPPNAPAQLPKAPEPLPSAPSAPPPVKTAEPPKLKLVEPPPPSAPPPAPSKPKLVASNKDVVPTAPKGQLRDVSAPKTTAPVSQAEEATLAPTGTGDVMAHPGPNAPTNKPQLSLVQNTEGGAQRATASAGERPTSGPAVEPSAPPARTAGEGTSSSTTTTKAKPAAAQGGEAPPVKQPSKPEPPVREPERPTGGKTEPAGGAKPAPEREPAPTTEPEVKKQPEAAETPPEKEPGAKQETSEAAEKPAEGGKEQPEAPPEKTVADTQKRLEEVKKARAENDAALRDKHEKRLAAQQRAREAQEKLVTAPEAEKPGLRAKADRNAKTAERLNDEIKDLDIRKNQLADEERALAPQVAKPQTWQEVEDLLRARYSGQKKKFILQGENREVDCFGADRIGREGKFGPQSLSVDIQKEINKDVELIQSGAMDGAEWHFFENPKTGIGPSEPLRNALREAQFLVRKKPFRIIIHP